MQQEKQKIRMSWFFKTVDHAKVEDEKKQLQKDIIDNWFLFTLIRERYNELRTLAQSDNIGYIHTITCIRKELEQVNNKKTKEYEVKQKLWINARLAASQVSLKKLRRTQSKETPTEKSSSAKIVA